MNQFQTEMKNKLERLQCLRNTSEVYRKKYRFFELDGTAVDVTIEFIFDFRDTETVKIYAFDWNRGEYLKGVHVERMFYYVDEFSTLVDDKDLDSLEFVEY